MPQPPTISDALENVRRSVALCRRQCDEIVQSTEVRPIGSVGIVGAGMMGLAIAREHAARTLPVVVHDADKSALERARRIGGAVRCTTTASDLADCDLVLESIAEKRPAKQALYKQLEPSLGSRAILATNTSTIPITRLASGLASPVRFCGMHYCHPVGVRPIIEVIPGELTSRETLAAVLAHARVLGKLPLLVSDGPGFVINRLLLRYLNKALDLVVAGLSPREIDRAMIAFGMPMGPLEQLDEIGLDTALQSGMVLGELADARSAGTELLVSLVKAGAMGVKKGLGIYGYPGKITNPAVSALESQKVTNGPEFESLPMQLLRPMELEAAQILKEGKAEYPWQIDLATIFGLGFPCWRGGLQFWSAQISVQ